MVSSTQNASSVSATRCPSHLICSSLGVRSRSGGRGNDWTFSGALGGMLSLDSSLEFKLRLEMMKMMRKRDIGIRMEVREGIWAMDLWKITEGGDDAVIVPKTLMYVSYDSMRLRSMQKQLDDPDFLYPQFLKLI